MSTKIATRTPSGKPTAWGILNALGITENRIYLSTDGHIQVHGEASDERPGHPTYRPREIRTFTIIHENLPLTIVFQRARGEGRSFKCAYYHPQLAAALGGEWDTADVESKGGPRSLIESILNVLRTLGMTRVSNIMFWQSLDHTATNLFCAGAGTNDDGTKIVYPKRERGMCYPVRLWGEAAVARLLKQKIEDNKQTAAARECERVPGVAALA